MYLEQSERRSGIEDCWKFELDEIIVNGEGLIYSHFGKGLARMIWKALVHVLHTLVTK